MTLLQHIEVKSFYEKSYGHDGFDAQRRYPNEELCRFMGRHYFPIPLEERRNVRILEVGCGSGANLWMIAREGFDAHGLDLSEEAIRLSARMLQHYKTKAILSIGDMTACPFPDEYFDAVVDIFFGLLSRRGWLRVFPCRSATVAEAPGADVLLHPVQGLRRVSQPCAGTADRCEHARWYSPTGLPVQRQSLSIPLYRQGVVCGGDC
jgi:SAM-dependent methyltransferase